MDNIMAVDILLVDDNPDDVLLTKEVLREGKVKNKLYVAEDGDNAMQFLLNQGKFADAPRPSIILLDLNLPGKDGREVLSDIKGDRKLKSIPVVILSSSNDEEDIKKMYEHNANAYITKPVDLDKFIKVIRTFEDFWLTIAKLPDGVRI
jgi:two-component system response regulator